MTRTIRLPIAFLVVFALTFATIEVTTAILDRDHPTRRPAPSVVVPHRATLVGYGQQPEVQEHCQFVWMTVQCYTVVQPWTVRLMANQINNYGSTDAAVAAGVVTGVCLLMIHPAAVIICGVVMGIRVAYAFDQIKMASAGFGCVEVHYQTAPWFVPFSVSAKAKDGGWCAGNWSSDHSGFDETYAGSSSGGGGGGGGGGSW